jgi:ketosteroid isomerase-like protein
MSQENVEIVRGAIDAWNRQDVDGILAVTKPEAEYVNAPEAVEPRTRRGHDELVAVVRTQWEALGPGARQEIDRLHDRGDEIISQVRASRTIPGSVDRIEIRILASWQIRDGKVSRVEILGAGSAFRKPSTSPGCRSRAITTGWFSWLLRRSRHAHGEIPLGGIS